MSKFERVMFNSKLKQFISEKVDDADPCEIKRSRQYVSFDHVLCSLFNTRILYSTLKEHFSARAHATFIQQFHVNQHYSCFPFDVS